MKCCSDRVRLQRAVCAASPLWTSDHLHQPLCALQTVLRGVQAIHPTMTAWPVLRPWARPRLPAAECFWHDEEYFRVMRVVVSFVILSGDTISYSIHESVVHARHEPSVCVGWFKQ